MVLILTAWERAFVGRRGVAGPKPGLVYRRRLLEIPSAERHVEQDLERVTDVDLVRAMQTGYYRLHGVSVGAGMLVFGGLGLVGHECMDPFPRRVMVCNHRPSESRRLRSVGTRAQVIPEREVLVASFRVVGAVSHVE